MSYLSIVYPNMSLGNRIELDTSRRLVELINEICNESFLSVMNLEDGEQKK
jgi:hypothetical protein